MVEWKETTLAGLPIESFSFSSDNRFLAVSSNYFLSTYFLNENRSPIRLECDSPIVSVTCTSANELITVTNDGELIGWEVMTDKLIRKSSLRISTFKIKHVVWSHSKKCSLWISEGSAKEGYDTLSVLLNDKTLHTLDSVPNDLNVDQVAVTDNFAVYCCGKQITKLSFDASDDVDAKEVFIYESTLAGLTDEQNAKNVFIRIAAFDSTVVASLAIGKVYVWNHLKTKKMSLASAFSLHWHKVSAPMAITPFGGLISAGAETVLCKWSLKAAGAPTMLPRLQAAVIYLTISNDGSHAALLMEDNSLHIVLLSTMSILCSLPTVTYSRRCAQSLFSRDPRVSGSFVMNGTPGWLQWLSLSSLTTTKQQCLSLENAVEGDMSDIRTVQTYHQLDKLYLGYDMAVSLESIVNFSEDNKRLRFWKRTSEYEFVLLDSISVSPNVAFINSSLRPKAEGSNVVTICSTAGTIEVWYQNQERTRWLKDVERCQTGWQNSSILSTTSITAENVWVTAHRSTTDVKLVVWNITNMAILDVFPVDGELYSLEWANDNDLLVSSSLCITCWSVKSFSPRWIIEQPLMCHISELGCYAWQDYHVIEFNPENGMLVNSIEFSSNVNELIAVKSEENKGNVTLVAKTTKGIAIARKEEPLDNTAALSAAKTPFSRLVAPSSSSSKSTAHKIRVPPTNYDLKLLIDPCHALPPLSHIAPLFIASCLASPVDVKL